MTRKEKNNIIKWANTLSDDELAKQYYDCAYDCLGTLTDAMYELGYDMSDIVEQEKHENLCHRKLIYFVCFVKKRNIELWV